ncbi:MAG: hypothetical protein K2N30_02570 [Clostridia bacterium]|nr:hypothetical protein [Clostridia bacterium]
MQDKTYFIENREVSWDEFLTALNSGNYELKEDLENNSENLVWCAVKNAHREIAEMKSKLMQTDYQAIKFAEGEMSEAEYAEVKEKRRAWRERINELEELL